MDKIEMSVPVADASMYNAGDVPLSTLRAVSKWFGHHSIDELCESQLWFDLG